MEGFDNMLEEERRGGRQMNAPRSWQEDQRQRIATKILVQERRIWRASLCATHPRHLSLIVSPKTAILGGKLINLPFVYAS